MIETFVAEMFPAGQVVPARRVSVFGASEEEAFVIWFSIRMHRLVTGSSHRTHLSDALAKQTGYVAEHPAFSHFLYFFSDWSSSSSVSVAFLLLWTKTKVKGRP